MIGCVTSLFRLVDEKENLKKFNQSIIHKSQRRRMNGKVEEEVPRKEIRTEERAIEAVRADGSILRFLEPEFRENKKGCFGSSEEKWMGITIRLQRTSREQGSGPSSGKDDWMGIGIGLRTPSKG
jgi:hypothetical protein